MHLTFNIGGVDGLAGILYNGEAQDLDLAGVGVDFDIGYIGGERAADTGVGVDSGAADDRATGLVEMTGEFPEGIGLVA